MELVRGILFCLRRSFPRFRMSLTDAAEPCVRPKLPAVQSCGEGISSAPPMVTPLRDCAPWKRAGTELNWPVRLLSQLNPPWNSMEESSIGENACRIMLSSPKLGLSSSSLSESAPNVNTFSWRCICSGSCICGMSIGSTCEGSMCPDMLKEDG